MTTVAGALAHALPIALLLGCGGEPAPVAAPTRAAPSASSRPPAPSTPSIAPEVQAHRDAELREWLLVDELIGRCYEAHWAADPNVAGAVAVRFTIEPTGRARAVSIAQADPHDEAAEACVVSSVEAMPFTPSAEPVERTIERRFEAP